jgi:hypothetical protein
MKNIRLNKIRQKINKIKKINLSNLEELKMEIQDSLSKFDFANFEYEWADGIRSEMVANIYYDKDTKKFKLVYDDLKAMKRDYEKDYPENDDDGDYMSEWSEYIGSTDDYLLSQTFSNMDDLVKFLDKNFERINFS